MDLARVHKKIGEAHFFLHHLAEQEPRIIGDKEPFDYYLSAFLSACRTVHYRLLHEHATTYKPWRKTWDASLTPDDTQLIKFMVDDRNVEVHERGSSRNVEEEGVQFPIGTHYVDGGMILIGGPPGMEPAVAQRPVYTFTISGTQRRVTEACSAYLALLQRMLEQFSADHP